MTRAFTVALLLAFAQSDGVDRHLPDGCVGHRWSRPITPRLLLACLHPEFSPDVHVVVSGRLESATRLLDSRAFIRLSVTQAQEFADTELDPAETFYLIRGLRRDDTSFWFQALDCERGRVVVQHSQSQSAQGPVVPQPLVITFRGALTDVFPTWPIPR